VDQRAATLDLRGRALKRRAPVLAAVAVALAAPSAHAADTPSATTTISPIRAPAVDAGAAPPLPTIALSGAIQIETHPGKNMLLWGAAASLALGRGRWQAALDLQLLSGDPSVAIGDVRTTLLAAAVAAGPRFALGRMIVDVDATGRLGGCWMSGHLTDPSVMPSSGASLVGSAGGRVGILLPTSARVSHLALLVEAGTMIHGLEAEVNGAAAASLSGDYLLFGFGFGEHR
jgi:hypothetical protein